MFEEGDKFDGPWNFGPPDSEIITVEELVKKVIRNWGSGGYAFVSPEDNLHEAKLLKLDSSKASFILGWKFKYNVDRAVTETVEWYKNFYNGFEKKEMLEFSTQQIKNFELTGNNE